MPFVGESYQGARKNREYRQKFSQVENTVALLTWAVEEYGVTVTTAMSSTNKLSTLFLKGIKIATQRSRVDIALIPCFQIPLIVNGRPVDGYRRWVTYYNIEKMQEPELLKKYVTDPILLCRDGWRDRFSRAVAQKKIYDRVQIQKLQVDWKILDEALDHFDGFNVILAELGSESDFLAMTGRSDLLKEVRDRLMDCFSCPIVVGVHHAGSTIPILEADKERFAAYVTPFNNLGALMLPTVKHALRAIQKSTRPIIAIKPLAGGRLRPAKAFQYVFNEARIHACMIGVASKREMAQDFGTAKQFLKRSC
jgi:hypothetical protein